MQLFHGDERQHADKGERGDPKADGDAPLHRQIGQVQATDLLERLDLFLRTAPFLAVKVSAFNLDIDAGAGRFFQAHQKRSVGVALGFADDLVAVENGHTRAAHRLAVGIEQPSSYGGRLLACAQ